MTTSSFFLDELVELELPPPPAGAEPLSSPRPTIYAGGESEAAKSLIALRCDAYVMHGDEPEFIAEKIADMRARRERNGLPPMQYGMADVLTIAL